MTSQNDFYVFENNNLTEVKNLLSKSLEISLDKNITKLFEADGFIKCFKIMLPFQWRFQKKSSNG